MCCYRKIKSFNIWCSKTNIISQSFLKTGLIIIVVKHQFISYAPSGGVYYNVANFYFCFETNICINFTYTSLINFTNTRINVRLAKTKYFYGQNFVLFPFCLMQILGTAIRGKRNISINSKTSGSNWILVGCAIASEEGKVWEELLMQLLFCPRILSPCENIYCYLLSKMELSVPYTKGSACFAIQQPQILSSCA